MPDTNPPADGPQAPPVTGEPPKAPEPVKTITLTQPEMDQMIQDRLAQQARSRYSDYDELKAKAAKLDEMEGQQKTDLEKAQAAATQAQKERDDAIKSAESTRRETAILVEATKQGADTDLVLAVLADSDDITVKDGKVIGAEAAITKLLEAKPHLKIGAVKKSGSDFGGNDGETVKEQIKKLEQEGSRESLAKARALKVASAFGPQ